MAKANTVEAGLGARMSWFSFATWCDAFLPHCLAREPKRAAVRGPLVTRFCILQGARLRTTWTSRFTWPGLAIPKGTALDNEASTS